MFTAWYARCDVTLHIQKRDCYLDDFFSDEALIMKVHFQYFMSQLNNKLTGMYVIPVPLHQSKCTIKFPSFVTTISISKPHAVLRLSFWRNFTPYRSLMIRLSKVQNRIYFSYTELTLLEQWHVQMFFRLHNFDIAHWKMVRYWTQYEGKEAQTLSKLWTQQIYPLRVSYSV